MVLTIPPANKQSARKPFYISSQTAAFGVAVVGWGSPSPAPASGQIIPFATPSPCAAATGGGYTCTLTVTAPLGEDQFFVATYGVASPGPNTTPLSVAESGEVNVGAGATPLPFTLNAVVASVTLSVASPDTGPSPNTQVFTVASPGTTMLGISALDANGVAIMDDPTTPFSTPIQISASPAAEGITFSLTSSSPCGSSVSASQASIACVADLSAVQVRYDGTPRPDASDHLIDDYTVSAPSASPASYVLASNIINTQIIPANGYVEPAFLGTTSGGGLWYAAYNGAGWTTGTYDPSTQDLGPQGTLANDSYVISMTMASNGNLWVNDDGPIDCYTSIAGGTPTLSGFYPQVSNGDWIYPYGMTTDASGNLWYVGYDDDYDGPPPSYAGYFTPSNCSTPNPSPSPAQYQLSNDTEEESVYLAPLPNGSVAIGSYSSYDLPNKLYLLPANGSGTINGATPLSSNQYGAGAAADGAGNVYATFTAFGSVPDIEELLSGQTAFSKELVSLPPTSGSLPSPHPSGLAAFSKTSGGAADRLEYVDTDYDALGLVESVQSSPMPLLVSLPNSILPFQAAYSGDGAEFVLDMDASENVNLVRIMPTRTWSVPNVALDSGCSASALLTILERGDSGPFTVSIPASAGITATVLPGADHDFWLTGVADGSFTATVTDANHRTEQFQVTAASSDVTCGLTHRKRVRRAHVKR